MSTGQWETFYSFSQVTYWAAVMWKPSSRWGRSEGLNSSCSSVLSLAPLHIYVPLSIYDAREGEFLSLGFFDHYKALRCSVPGALRCGWCQDPGAWEADSQEVHPL